MLTQTDYEGKGGSSIRKNTSDYQKPAWREDAPKYIEYFEKVIDETTSCVFYEPMLCMMKAVYSVEQNVTQAEELW